MKTHVSDAIEFTLEYCGTTGKDIRELYRVSFLDAW